MAESMSLAVVLHRLGRIELRHHLGRACIDDILALLCDVLPPGTPLPRTAKMFHSVLDLQQVDQYERQLCTCGWLYPPVDRKEWTAVACDVCPKCNEPRFNKQRDGSLKALVVCAQRAALTLS